MELHVLGPRQPRPARRAAVYSGRADRVEEAAVRRRAAGQDRGPARIPLDRLGRLRLLRCVHSTSLSPSRHGLVLTREVYRSAAGAALRFLRSNSAQAPRSSRVNSGATILPSAADRSPASITAIT